MTSLLTSRARTGEASVTPRRAALATANPGCPGLITQSTAHVPARGVLRLAERWDVRHDFLEVDKWMICPVLIEKNKGEGTQMDDLSDLSRSSVAVSSMSAGNMQSSNREAMTAPGSRPVDPEIREQGDPSIQMDKDPAVDRRLEHADSPSGTWSWTKTPGGPWVQH